MAIRYEPLTLIHPLQPHPIESQLTARQNRAFQCITHQSSSQLSYCEPIMYTDSRMRAVLPIARLVLLIAVSRSMLSVLPCPPHSSSHGTTERAAAWCIRATDTSVSSPSSSPYTCCSRAELPPRLLPRHEVQLGRCSRSFSRAICGFSYGAT